MTARKPPRRIFIDTNVLFNDFLFRNPGYGLKNPPGHEITNRKQANEALTLLRLQPSLKTYVADFSIVKVISLMDGVKTPKALQLREIQTLLTKNVVTSLGGKLIQSTVDQFKSNTTVNDLEDALQFAVSQKQDCSHIITFNKADFTPFDVSVIVPAKIRTLVF